MLFAATQATRRRPVLGTTRVRHPWVAIASLLIAAGLTAPAIAQGDTWSLSVPGTANLYGAGHSVPPAPDGNGGGTLPPGVTLPTGSNCILRVVSATGLISFTPSVPSNGPDGVAYGSYLGFDWGGIAGCKVHRIRQLNGIFLDASEPVDPPPAELVADSMTFRSLPPLLRQTFPMGDGLTATAAGDTQLFVVPAGATRLFLGFIDSFSGTQPGWYGDNSGALAVEISVVAGEPLDVAVDVPGAFRVLVPMGNALRGGTRIRFVLPAQTRVRAEILDVSGRTVCVVGQDSNEGAGLHERTWDGRDAGGRRVAPGVYFAHVRTSAGSGSVRVIAF